MGMPLRDYIDRLPMCGAPNTLVGGWTCPGHGYFMDPENHHRLVLAERERVYARSFEAAESRVHDAARQLLVAVEWHLLPLGQRLLVRWPWLRRLA